MNTKKLALFFVPLTTTLLTGCMTVADHREGLRDSSDQKITLGVAQREIREGMSQADVAQALGSPNMVTKDRDGIETWIYDKVSTETAFSTSKNGIAGLVLGTGAIVGAGGGSSSQASGASSRTQRTLTIIIKFKKSVVSEFTYNSTSF